MAALNAWYRSPKYRPLIALRRESAKDMLITLESASLALHGGARTMSAHGPSVWTGRASQAESDDLEKLVLRFCIRPIEGAFEPLAIMDIRARSISFASRPQRAIRAT
jgi:hypothetical protein